jgi:hypothetical protein
MEPDGSAVGGADWAAGADADGSGAVVAGAVGAAATVGVGPGVAGASGVGFAVDDTASDGLVSGLADWLGAGDKLGLGDGLSEAPGDGEARGPIATQPLNRVAATTSATRVFRTRRW